MSKSNKVRRLCAPNGRPIVGAQVTVTAVRSIESLHRGPNGRVRCFYGDEIKLDPLTERTEMVDGHAVFVADDGSAFTCDQLIEEDAAGGDPPKNRYH